MKTISYIPVEKVHAVFEKYCYDRKIDFKKLMRAILTEITKYNEKEFIKYLKFNVNYKLTRKAKRIWKLKFFFDKYIDSSSNCKISIIKAWQKTHAI